ncbi:hypothetical protein ACFY3N_31620 [Streptomyces sp. NPDC000348]|uniref:hypothetical protein n=1 Tax=Streptomyces sp. NPDC000348 TaxID=3364538 RepID=UPI00369FAB7A
MAELNGRPVTPDALLTLALTNYGHFTSMRVDNQRVRGLGLHMERLVKDCRVVTGAELDPERVLGYVRQATSDLTGSFVVRVTVFDPAVTMGRPRHERGLRAVRSRHRLQGPAALAGGAVPGQHLRPPRGLGDLA